MNFPVDFISSSTWELSQKLQKYGLFCNSNDAVTWRYSVPETLQQFLVTAVKNFEIQNLFTTQLNSILFVNVLSLLPLQREFVA